DRTLIVSVPTAGALLYFDSATGKELKKVEVAFQPSALALQGRRLFAAAKGSAVVYVLDAATGKQVKEIKLKGDPVEGLACHPVRGLLYAVSGGGTILAINPTNGRSAPTRGKGQMLVVDPAGGKFVYAGVHKPMPGALVMRAGRGKTETIFL